MSSIIEGYNYDIFISYRQKDNKHDGWVTDFVNNLKGELESTFKEEISVYFDINKAYNDENIFAPGDVISATGPIPVRIMHDLWKLSSRFNLPAK
jgi:hypothetical protein